MLIFQFIVESLLHYLVHLSLLPQVSISYDKNTKNSFLS